MFEVFDEEFLDWFAEVDPGLLAKLAVLAVLYFRNNVGDVFMGVVEPFAVGGLEVVIGFDGEFDPSFLVFMEPLDGVVYIVEAGREESFPFLELKSVSGNRFVGFCVNNHDVFFLIFLGKAVRKGASGIDYGAGIVGDPLLPMNVAERYVLHLAGYVFGIYCGSATEDRIDGFFVIVFLRRRCAFLHHE